MTQVGESSLSSTESPATQAMEPDIRVRWKALEFEYAKRLRECPAHDRKALYTEAYSAVSELAVERFKSDRPEDRTAGTSKKTVALIAKFVEKNDRVLEVGCGAGYFLEKLLQQGKKVQGVELNTAAAAFAREREVPVAAVALEDFAAQHRESFAAVCLFQVIEHVAEPLEFLDHALTCLQPGGLLVLCVPNMAGILGRMDPLVSNIPPHHVTRWTPAALGFLKNHFPVELIALRYEPAYNFLRPYLKERLEHQGVPEWGVKLIWRLGLSLPLKLLRHLKPAGLQSLPGHTVYALYRKQVY